MVWDANREDFAIWDPAKAQFQSPDVKPVLEGKFKVRLADGKEIFAATVWNEFCNRVAEYPLEKVAQITWLPEKDIIEAARMYATSKPASIQWGMAIDATPAVTPTAQAITDLWCITGNLDTPGGNVIARYAFGCCGLCPAGGQRRNQAGFQRNR